MNVNLKLSALQNTATEKVLMAGFLLAPSLPCIHLHGGLGIALFLHTVWHFACALSASFTGQVQERLNGESELQRDQRQLMLQVW